MMNTLRRYGKYRDAQMRIYSFHMEFREEEEEEGSND